jgi:hypothetical protein
MRIACFAVLFCLALAACDREPTFDASSLPAYQKSLSAIKTRLSDKDQQKLQLALLTLAAGSSAEYTAFASTIPDAPARIEALDDTPNSLMILDRMRPGIAGKTAAAVIREVADDLDVAIARADADGVKKALAAFDVENPRFSWNRASRFALPTMAFSVYNGGRKSISGIVLAATLTDSDHHAPLAAGDVFYHFATALQPGVQQDIEIAFRAPGPWTTKQIETASDLTLRLKISNVFDSNGKGLPATNVGWLDVMRKKRDFLRGG